MKTTKKESMTEKDDKGDNYKKGKRDTSERQIDAQRERERERESEKERDR